MVNGQRLSPEQQKALGTIVIVVGLILSLLVLIIMIARFVFGLSIIMFFGSIIYLIIGIFIDWNRTRSEDYFDGFPNSLLAVGLILLFWAMAHFSFPIGYSELSYQIIDWNKEYQEIMGLPLQIIIESLNETCQTIPTYSGCDTILKSYQMSDKVGGISETAKMIKWMFDLRI